MLPMRDIKAFARRIAKEFKPRRIILFGSYAYGKPTRNSDVDLMVVMPHRGDYVRKAIEMRMRIDAPFPLDLPVRSGRERRERYRPEDWFIREIVDKGKILYETSDPRMGRQGRSRLRTGATGIPCPQARSGRFA